MTWTRLDDGFYDDPDVEAAGNEAVGAFCRMLCYCGRQLTDGDVPTAKARAIARPAVLARLEEHDFIRSTGDGWHIRNYLKFNPSRKQVLAERSRASERMRKLRANGA